jgi:hypothetical protein
MLGQTAIYVGLNLLFFGIGYRLGNYHVVSRYMPESSISEKHPDEFTIVGSIDGGYRIKTYNAENIKIKNIVVHYWDK